MPRRRLLWQLFPSYLVITLLSLLAVTWYATRSLRGFYRAETQTMLEARARLVEKQLLATHRSGDKAAVDALCKDLGSRSDTRITAMLPSGVVVGESDEDTAKMELHNTPDRPEMMAALGGEVGVATRQSATLNKDMMYVAVPLFTGEGEAREVELVVRTSFPVTSVEDALRHIHAELAIAGLVIAVFAGVVSLVVSRRISQPLEEMKQGADRFAEGDLHVRLPVPETAELASLAEAMNQMAAQLEERLNTILRQRNEQEAILASMVEGVVAVDNDERLISMNVAATAMLGVDDGKLEGRSIQEAVRNPALQRFVAGALAEPEVSEGEIELVGNGQRVLQAHGAALRDAEGRQIGAVVVLNDVTRLRRLESIRREFVANVSHELRTPITSVKGFVETLLDGALGNPEDATRFLGIIARQVDRLNAIIEDLLLLSRLEQDTGQPAATLEEATLKDVLDAAVQVCSLKATEKDMALRVTCAAGFTARINAPLLEQAVVNLVHNAINYSEPGRAVEIVAEPGDGETIVRVADQGCGIGPEHLPRLFERFYRVDRARSRKLGGTGLGLAIVKHIAQAHGGRVTVESEPGKGSVFTIHLPA